ncbi:MAG TPA: PAS domain S-box protein [Rubrobacteraceae bacterium]|nr:PAS domain S-box protein [Rubrobacteraceae bacterium]
MQPPESDEAPRRARDQLLSESEERFRLLVEGVKDYAIFMLDPEGRITTWNPGAQRIKGYEAEEIVGEHFSIFYTDEDIERGHPEEELRVAADGGSYEEEGIRVRKDGSTFWANVLITALRDDAGNLRGFAKVTRDITARKEAEERERQLALEQAAGERATDILESISDAFFAVDHEWRFTYVNKKAEELWGRSREELLAKNIWEEFPQAQGSESYRQIQRAMVEGVTTEFETISSVLGTWVAGRAYPSRVGLSVYFQDVTEHKLAEKEIRRSEERYRSFVEQSTEGIWRFELEEPVPQALPEDEQIERFYRHAYLAECNNAMAEMYGFERAEELVGARLADFLPRSVPENVEYLRAFIRSGHQLTDAESQEVDREGRLKRFLNNLTGIVEDGFLVRAWGTQRDVTDQKRAEEMQGFLAEASDVLSSSLDYRETLSSVARLAVPTLADWCAVDVLAENGSAERLAVEHPDPRKVALAYKLQEQYPPDPDAPRGLNQVLRTGEPDMMSEIPEEILEQAARDEQHREIIRELGLRSYMVVPLVARGRTLGAITFVTAESGRRYGEADLELATQLAHRAALAVDNARLYEESQREIAERRWAQAELRDSRDQLEIILSGVADGIIAQDPTGRIFYANETAARMSGYPSVRAFVEAPLEERLGKFELLDADARPFPLERLPGRRALLGERDAEEVLRFRVLGTGEERWSVVRATPIFDEEGRVRMAISIMRDITERKRAEESLRRVAEVERRRIARDLHDGVLQDLSYTAAAMGLIMLEVEGTPLEGELQSNIDAVRRAAQGLRDAVNDLRLEEEQDRPLAELVKSVVQRNQARTQDCEITLEVEEGFPSTPLGENGTQVARIVQEGITNARRHSGSRKVSVTLRMGGGDLVAEVSDDGRGFGPETTPGVGFSSMRERAAVIGGQLKIESQPGQGTSVRLRVPMPQGTSG